MNISNDEPNDNYANANDNNNQAKDFMKNDHKTCDLNECYFKNNTNNDYDSNDEMSKFQCFLAISAIFNDEGGLFRMSEQKTKLKWKLLSLEDIHLLAIEQLVNEDRIILFLLKSNDKINNQHLFRKTFKLFFPSKRQGYSCVNQNNELKKYKLLGNHLKKDCDAMNKFIVGLGSFFQSEVLQEITENASEFSEILKILTYYGKSVAKNSSLKDEFDIEIAEEILNQNHTVAQIDKGGITAGSVYEKEKPIMLEKLIMLEKASFQIPIKVTEFEKSIKRNFITGNIFLDEVKKTIRSISERSRKNSKSPSRIIQGSVMSSINQEGFVIQEDMGKENITLINKNKQGNDKKLDIQLFHSDFESFDDVEHIFIDASWINKFMLIPIVTIRKTNKPHKEDEPSFWIYRVIMIFFIEGELKFPNEEMSQRLTPKGTNELYKKIFGIVKDKCKNVKSVSSDFEAAILHGIDFHKLKRWGCYFHYIQRLRTNCSENHRLLSNQCMSILKILPFVDLKFALTRKQKLDQIEQKFKHKPDLEMFQYVRKQYLNKTTVFNQKVISNHDNINEREIEYFKFTDNASERVFKEIKASMKGFSLEKQNIINTILLFLRNQTCVYVGRRARSTKKKPKNTFNCSKLGHNFRHAKDKLKERQKQYRNAIENKALEGITLSNKTIDDIIFGTKKTIIIEKKKRKLIDIIAIPDEYNLVFSEKLKLNSHLQIDLLRRPALSDRHKHEIATKIETLNNEELNQFKRIKHLTTNIKKDLEAKFEIEIEKAEVKFERVQRELSLKLKKAEQERQEFELKREQELKELELKRDKERKDLELKRAHELKELEFRIRAELNSKMQMKDQELKELQLEQRQKESQLQGREEEVKGSEIKKLLETRVQMDKERSLKNQFQQERELRIKKEQELKELKERELKREQEFEERERQMRLRFEVMMREQTRGNNVIFFKDEKGTSVCTAADNPKPQVQ